MQTMVGMLAREQIHKGKSIFFLLDVGPVTWQSVLQPTMALSTTDAEYMAAAAIREALWLLKVLIDLGLSKRTVRIPSDHQSALELMQNPEVSKRLKQIDVLHHFVREWARRGDIVFKY
jgi:hypothetical protein